MILKSIIKEGTLKNKRVLIRVDWNVPLDGGRVRDDYRIKTSLPTIEYVRNVGAKVIVATHLEPPGVSLKPLFDYVPTGVELLGNLRDESGEIANSAVFAKKLAGLADIYVNEAFSVSHRKHASIVRIPRMIPAYAGLQFVKEVEELSRAFHPPHPFLLVLGGAKSLTKLPLLEKFTDIADSIFVGGALAKAVSETLLARNAKIIFPIGAVTALDANPETLALLEQKILDSKFIIWNGPLGNYEQGFKKGTLGLAKMLSESGKQVIVGGGDTLAVIKELDILDKFSFVSSGGGAMLDFLATGTLPGIEALTP